MKKICLSLLLMGAVPCSAMDSDTLSAAQSTLDMDIIQLNRFGEGLRKRVVKFGNDAVTLNGVTTQYENNSEFFLAIDTLIDICEARYTIFVQQLHGSTSSNDQRWIGVFADHTLEEMKFLKDGIFRILYDNPNSSWIFNVNREKTHLLFEQVLNLLEKMHDIRIKALKRLPAITRAQYHSQLLVDEIQEHNFQCYSDELHADVQVNDWYERMRNNDI